jgi:Ca2+-binding EF-hand superfamily protein
MVRFIADISTGIDKQTFINGLRGAGTDGVKLISRVFDTIDYSRNGYLSWEEFLNAMNLFVFSNLDQKIDLFFTAYDPTGLNKVSFKDISELCKLQIKRAAHTEIQDDLSESFAEFLFNFAGAKKEQGLSKNELKSVLNKESTDMNLVEMFCSFNFLNKFLASKYEDIEYLLLEHNNSENVT